MTTPMWLLVGSGGESESASSMLEELTAQVAASHPDIRVRSVAFGSRLNVSPTLKKLADAGETDITLVPVWLSPSEGLAADLTQFFLRMQEVHPRLSLKMAAPLTVQPEVAALVARSAELAVPAVAVTEEPPTDAQRATRRRRSAPKYERLALVCTGSMCLGRGSWEISAALDAAVKEVGATGARVQRTACLGPCSAGPVMHVLPDGTWYGGLNLGDVHRIAEEHLREGRTCEDLVIRPVRRRAAPSE